MLTPSRISIAMRRLVRLLLCGASLWLGLTLPTIAHAGWVDLINGVKVGQALPPHELSFLSDTQPHEVRVRLIDFWATWCAPCVAAIPSLNALQRQWADKGLEVVGVSKEALGVQQAFLARHPMHYPHALDVQGRLYQGLGIKALPYAIFVDSKGQVLWRGQPSEIDEALLQGLLRQP